MAKKFLSKEYKYRRKFINACILRIRYGHRKEKTIQGYKTYVFKSMKIIIDKNICNYMNLLNGSACEDLPEYNEVLAECYLVFNDCLSKYKITKYNNFYFYFNKALSRKFYRCYCRELHRPKAKITKEMTAVNPKFSHNPHLHSEEIIFNSLNFSELEREIVRSRLKKETITEFLKEHEGVSRLCYQKTLENIKFLLKQAIDGNKY